MSLFKKINWTALIITICVGLFFCYILTPEPKVIVRFPTPENASSTIYIDKSNNCYKFKANEVRCPSDKTKITKNPIII